MLMGHSGTRPTPAPLSFTAWVRVGIQAETRELGAADRCTV
jgi:hypothetical protein